MNLKSIVIGLALIAAAFAVSLLERHLSSGSPRPSSAAGAFAPDFSLPLLAGAPTENSPTENGPTGDRLALSSYRGKVVLLDFWATWCGPCREEIPHFVELQNKYGPQGLQIIGISMDDSPDPVGAFSRQFKINYPVVMGNAKTGQLYGGVLGLPINFIIGRDGRIESRHIGATDISVFEREIATQLAN